METVTRADEPAIPEQQRAVKRRGILAAAGAAMAGVIAKQTAQPVGAFNQLNLETANTVNSAPTILNVVSTYAGTSVLQVDASASDTQAASYIDAIRAIGAYNGSGVWGTGGNATNVGGSGVSFAGDGLFGQGGRGGSANGIVRPGAAGVSGYGGDNAGGGGSGGEGVRATGGNATSGGNGGYGVYAVAGTGMATSGVYAVNANSGAGNTGITGFCSGAGGSASSGNSGSGTGVLGQTNAANQYGVLGTTYAANSTAVAGTCTQNGSSAFSGGTTNPNAYAGVFQGNVVIQGRLVVSDPGYKSGVLAHPDGSHRLVYCVESPESWIEDVGMGTLANGTCSVKFDLDFAAVVHTDAYHVFLTEYDAPNHLYVTDRITTGFTVRAEKPGATGTFSWKVMVKAKSNVKSERLGKFTMPNIPLPDTSKFKVPGKPIVTAPKKP